VPIGDGDMPSLPFGSWGFFAPVRGDDGHDRSFITRDQRDAGPMAPGRSVSILFSIPREYDRSDLKENGTIPF
jgi:hypothetical protein